MSGTIKDVNDDNFKSEVLDAERLVVVDFWHPRIPASKMMDDAFDFAATEYKDRVQMVMMNVDESPKTAKEYGITDFPVVKVFQGGEDIDGEVGMMSSSDLVSFIGRNL